MSDARALTGLDPTELRDDEVPMDELFSPICLTALLQAEGKDHKLLLCPGVCGNQIGFRFVFIILYGKYLRLSHCSRLFRKAASKSVIDKMLDGSVLVYTYSSSPLNTVE